jgi:hypothetical protein
MALGLDGPATPRAVEKGINGNGASSARARRRRRKTTNTMTATTSRMNAAPPPMTNFRYSPNSKSKIRDKSLI